MKPQTAFNRILQTVTAFSLLAAATPFTLIDGPCNSLVWIVGQTVSTTSGLVVGHAAADASEVSEYLGIRYAVPPVGPLRFQPPVRYTGNGTVNATVFVGSSLFSGFSWNSMSYLNHLHRMITFLLLLAKIVIHRVQPVSNHHQDVQARQTQPARIVCP